MDLSIKLLITLIVVLDVIMTHYFLRLNSATELNRVKSINNFIIILTKIIAIFILIKLWFFDFKF
jgi:hypothetical protein